MVDVLLIQPPVQDFYLTAKRTIPYGLTCIAAALQAAGYSVELFDALATPKKRSIPRPAELDFLAPYYGRPDCSPFALFHQFQHFGYSFEHIGAVARASSARLVGISSLFSAYSDCALRTAEIVKKNLPQCRIVMGGHHPTALPEAVIRHPAVDFVLRGEGEVSLPMLVKALKQGGDLTAIPGIVFRKDNEIFQASAPALMDDLNAYPPPAVELIRHNFYQRNKAASAVVVGSRGCPLRCSYCAVAGWPYRRRKTDAVAAEIARAVHDHGARFIDFEDENLSLDRAWFGALLDELISRFKDFKLELRAMNGLFPATLDADILHKMKQAGFRTLNLSLGSIDPDQLTHFHRPDTKADFEKILAQARNLGLLVTAYIIVGAPGQQPESSVADILYLAGKGVLVGVSAYYLAPGSRDFAERTRSGQVPSDFRLMRGSALTGADADKRRDTATLLRLGRITNFMKWLAEADKDVWESAGLHARVRMTAGQRLLAQFLQDGLIRGITPTGEVFLHTTSLNLTSRFLAGLGSGKKI